MKPYLIHYGFELHPATEKVENKVNKSKRAQQGPSRAGVETAGPVLVKCSNTLLVNSCRIGDLLITPILQETHATGEFLQNREEIHSILKGLLPKGKEKTKGHRTRRTSSNTVCIPPALHARVPGVDRAPEVASDPRGQLPNSFGVKAGLLNPPKYSNSISVVK